MLLHGIKLFPPGTGPITPPKETSSSSKEPIIHEYYDEVVFTNPSESFHRQLMRASVLPRIVSAEPLVQANFPMYSDEDDMKRLLEATKYLEDAVADVKRRIGLADEARDEIDMEMARLKAAASSSSASTSSSSSGAVGNNGDIVVMTAGGGGGDNMVGGGGNDMTTSQIGGGGGSGKSGEKRKSSSSGGSSKRNKSHT